MSDINNQEIVIIDLFNQALSSGNDRIRLQHLRHIQELIIRKHPDLLERFIQDILNFQTNKSPEIKKLIISFIDEACQSNPQIIMKIIHNLQFFLYDENRFVQNKFIISMISIYKSILLWISKSELIDQDVHHMWENMTDIKNQIISMLNSDNDGLHKAIIKFIEILVLVNNHEILCSIKLQQEQKDMIEKLIEFTLRYPSDNLIAAIEALTNIARQRSDYVNRVVQTFETLNLSDDSQVNSLRERIQLKLILLLKHSNQQTEIVECSSDKVFLESKRKLTVNNIENIKKTKTKNISQISKPFEYDQMQRMSIDSFCRILHAEDIYEKAGISHIHEKIILSLVCLSEQSFRDCYEDYIFTDIYKRYNLALAWIYQEYIYANGYVTDLKENKDFTKYDDRLCRLLEYLQKYNDLFSRLITNVPLITKNALLILKRYCQNEVRIGMKILHDLIFRRMPMREQLLDILIDLTYNKSLPMRNNAIQFVKNFYEKNEFKQLIEGRYKLKCLEYLKTSQLSEIFIEEIQNLSDIDRLIPVLDTLEKHEILNVLPKLIKLSPLIVKQIFNVLLGLNGMSHTTSILPSELLIALHQISLEECELKTIINAISLCFNERSVYTQEILTIVIEQLIDISPIPTLFMRTVLQTITLYPEMIAFVTNILQRLIITHVWKQNRIWEGFIKCCEKIRPYSSPLLLQLPPSQLKHVFQTAPELHKDLLHHLNSISIVQRSSIPSSILTVIEDNKF